MRPDNLNKRLTNAIVGGGLDIADVEQFATDSGSKDLIRYFKKSGSKHHDVRAAVDQLESAGRLNDAFFDELASDPRLRNQHEEIESLRLAFASEAHDPAPPPSGETDPVPPPPLSLPSIEPPRPSAPKSSPVRGGAPHGGEPRTTPPQGEGSTKRALWLLTPPPHVVDEAKAAVDRCSERPEKQAAARRAIDPCKSAFTGAKVIFIWFGALAWVLPLYLNLRFSDLAVFNLFQLVLFTYHVAAFYAWMKLRFYVLDQPAVDQPCDVVDSLLTSDKIRAVIRHEVVSIVVIASWLLYLIAPASLVGLGSEFRSLGVPRSVFQFFGVEPPGVVLRLSEGAKTAVHDGDLALLLERPCDEPEVLVHDAVYLLGQRGDGDIDVDKERLLWRPKCWLSRSSEVAIVQVDVGGQVASWCDCEIVNMGHGEWTIERIGECLEGHRFCTLQ